MTVLNYYVDGNFNPVPIIFSNKKKINNHYLKRRNLLERHLNFNLSLLKNKEILEFGPNGGENACLLAEYGCKIYIVEPNIKLHKLIKKNFQIIKKNKSLKLLSKKKVEDFKIKKKFDIVVAEGFINTLENRNFYVKKISKFVKPGGYLILNYDDVYGGFFEYLKSFLLLRLCFKKKINPKSKKGYELAIKLFKNQFNKLNKSRNFYSWWRDQLINPYASKVWSMRELINLANSLKLICFSNSPVFSNLNHYNWYKNISERDFYYKHWNKKILDEWKNNYFNFFLGKNIKSKTVIDKKLLSLIEVNTKKMNKMLLNNELDIKTKFPETFYKFLKYNNRTKLAQELKELFRLLNINKNNSDDIVKYYINSSIDNMWGNLLHYIVFKK